MNKLKWIILVESIVIAILAFTLVYQFNTAENQRNYLNQNGKEKLVSTRVYSGTLEPKNLLILNLKPLQNEITNYTVSNRLNLSLYVLNMRDGSSFGIDANHAYQPASLNKLPVAMVIMRLVEKGKLSLDTILPIKDEDKDSGSGTLYSTTLTGMSVRELLYYMLAQSDNTAFKALGEQVTLKDLEDLSSYLNYYGNDINYTDPKNNIYGITPKSTANLFISLYLSTVLELRDSELILSDLTNTSFDINKYANIPYNVTIAQKYGTYYVGEDKYFHSCGIMYVEDSRIFYCIMTSGLDREPASEVVGNIVNKIYKFTIDTKDQLKGIDDLPDSAI